MATLSDQIRVKRCQFWKLPKTIDPRGHLTIAELATIPIPVRRLFFVSGVPVTESRGQCAHRSGEELLFAINGSVSVTIEDGICKQEIILDDCSVGLIIGPRIWSTQTRFSEGVVLAVLASESYNANDIIRNYTEFRSMVVEN